MDYEIICPNCADQGDVSVLCWVFAKGESELVAECAGDNEHPPPREPNQLATCSCGCYWGPPKGYVFRLIGDRPRLVPL